VPLYAKSNACPFVYARASGNHVLLVLFNPAAKPADAQFRFPIAYRQLERLAGKEIHFTQNGPDLQVELAAGLCDLPRVK